MFLVFQCFWLPHRTAEFKDSFLVMTRSEAETHFLSVQSTLRIVPTNNHQLFMNIRNFFTTMLFLNCEIYYFQTLSNIMFTGLLAKNILTALYFYIIQDNPLQLLILILETNDTNICYATRTGMSSENKTPLEITM